MDIRVGIGFDSHEFDESKPLYLGGVLIEKHPGLRGHSDGDVILHAITDALLGAVGEGDIGTFFSDEDPGWKGASSRVFVKRALEVLTEKKYSIVNLDIVYIARSPRIASIREMLIESISGILGVERSRVFVKGKRDEGLGINNGAISIATVLLERKGED